MPTAATGTFTIDDAASEWLVKVNSNEAGGFNRTFALACDYPAAFIGTQKVISAKTVTSKWTSFAETCITKVSPVGA